MRNLRHLIRRSGLLSTEKRRRRSEKARRGVSSPRRLSSEALEQRQLLAGDILASNHNYWNSYDVNDDGRISSRDALGVINYLGRSGEGELVADADGPKMYYDVNADHQITAADALGVINAMSRGEEVGELVELILTARDLNDQELQRDTNGEYNVDVGQPFDIEVSYDDLRLFNNQLGVFQLFTDITVSQGDVLKPILNETQRLIIGGEIQSIPSTSVTFNIAASPPGVSGAPLTYVSPINDFSNDSLGEVAEALRTFGYTDNQFELDTLDFGNDDLGFQVHFVGDQFGNVNLPNITVDVNESNASDDIPTQSIEFAPFEADGVTPNSDAVRFNVNTFSRTFNDNEEFYSAQNRGEFDSATGYTGLGGLGMVPLEGGGIPQLTDNGSFVQPFDAFSLRVFIDEPVQNLEIGVNPGEDPEATLLYGRDEAVPQDMVLVETTPAADAAGNGIANFIINATPPDEPGTFNISPTTTNVTEGDGSVTLTVTRTGGTAGSVTVSFGTSDGSALAGSDYVTSLAVLEFGDGQGSQEITVPIINDAVPESSEDFTVTLSNATGGASLGSNVVSTITIIDDDTPMPGVFNIDPASRSVNEDAGTVSLTVTRTEGTAGAVTVDFATVVSTSTATPGADYTATSDTLNFADGESSQTITIPILNDDQDEPDETFFVTLSNPTGGSSLGQTVSSTVTILDDDDPIMPGEFSITPLTDSVNENVGTVTLTVTRNNGSDGAVSVNFSTVNGTAIAGSDYNANSGTLNFADGETSMNVTVTILDDTEDENNEDFQVALSSATGGAVIVPQAQASTITILDNDGVIPQPGELNITSTASVNEDDGTVSLTVTRSNGSDGAVSVNFATANVSAAAGSDYTATSGTLNFADGETSMNITVPILDDSTDENNETFTVTLSNATGGATLGSSTVATVTIVDDDEPPVEEGVFSISPGSTSRSESAGTVTFTVNRTGGSDGAVSVNFATANGSATAGQDYTANSGTLNFADGETSRTFSVSIIDDVADEPDETFSVNLSGATGGATIGSPSSSTVTILDNDLPGNIPPSTISGWVFIDNDEDPSPTHTIRNGDKESDERGLGGVEMHLVSMSTGQTVATTLTDAEGYYEFDGVAPGQYEVGHHIPHQFIISVAASELPVSIPSAGDADVTEVNFPILETAGAAINSLDILASSLRGNHGIDIGDKGREGGIALLDEDGNLKFIVLGSGFEGITDAELVLNAEQDAALLTVIEEDGDVRSALLNAEDIRVNEDGCIGVQFLGGLDDHDFFDPNGDSLSQEFANFRNLIDQVMGDL